MKKTMITLLAGIVLGAALMSGSFAEAAEAFWKAYPSTHKMYLDGQQVELEAYVINGSNYVRLRDVGEAVGFNVYWDSENNCVQINSDVPYTGQPPTDTTELDAVRQDIVQLVNRLRQENGVQFLAVNDSLMAAAQECSDKLYTWHHTREECEAAMAHGYPYGFGSNLTVFTGADVQDVAERAVKNWTNSPGHFQTMIDPAFDSIGVGVTREQGITYCYMFVGDPNSHNPYE